MSDQTEQTPGDEPAEGEASEETKEAGPQGSPQDVEKQG